MNGDRPILVVGRTGQLARCLADEAAHAPAPLVFAGRETLNLADPITIGHVLNAIAPQAIINAAAYTAVDTAEANSHDAATVNHLGVGQLARQAAMHNVPMIHVSTDCVFDGRKQNPYVETDAPNPVSVYGRTKADGERAFLKSGARGTIVRTSWVSSRYGANFLKVMVDLAKRQDEVRVVTDQVGRPTHAMDLARVCFGLVGRWISGESLPTVLHYAGKGDASRAEFADEIFETLRALGRPSARVIGVLTADLEPRPAHRPLNARLDTSAIEALGIQTLPWRVRVRECVRELCDQEGA